MLCHFRHRFHGDPFARLGLQDITAWVDFTAVAEAALAAGMTLAGYTTQAHFLIGCGIAEFIADVTDLDIAERVNLSRQTMVLTLPGEMGERFKVIALAKGTMRRCSDSPCGTCVARSDRTQIAPSPLQLRPRRSRRVASTTRPNSRSGTRRTD